MENKLFRQHSIDRISSPEELHDYMRVTSPRLWMILSAILALLIGFIVYASTATMENVMPITVSIDYDVTAGETVDMYYAYGQLPLTQKDTLSPGMTVRLAGIEGKIDSIFTDQENVGVLIAIEPQNKPLPKGDCEAEIVLESTTPISFLLN